jgi:aspartyl-tRNA(Asn)/glutamyl-tRNA(Gln) amidotransferase subunit C
MPLSLDDVKRIAVLARLSVTEAEVEQTLVELNGVFALIEQMRAANTRDVEPMSHAQDVILRLRPDTVSEPDQHELFQSVAPQVEAGLYLVPKVIE